MFFVGIWIMGQLSQEEVRKLVEIYMMEAYYSILYISQVHIPQLNTYMEVPMGKIRIIKSITRKLGKAISKLKWNLCILRILVESHHFLMPNSLIKLWIHGHIIDVSMFKERKKIHKILMLQMTQ